MAGRRMTGLHARTELTDDVMKKTIIAIVAALWGGGVGSAWARPITYTFTGTGSGSLGANSFTAAAFTITALADTSQVVVRNPFFTYVPTSSATIDVSGIGSANFTGSTEVFVNPAVPV